MGWDSLTYWFFFPNDDIISYIKFVSLILAIIASPLSLLWLMLIDSPPQQLLNKYYYREHNSYILVK